MNKTIILLCALASFASVACSEERTKMPWEDDLNNKVPPQETETPEAKVGEPLPQWTEGCLDIHFINSGRGECAYYILPDGTTLLVDAGEIVITDGTGVPQKPDASTVPTSRTRNTSAISCPKAVRPSTGAPRRISI